MNLDTLVFNVDTSKLKGAVDDINNLATAVEDLNNKLKQGGGSGGAGGAGNNPAAPLADGAAPAEKGTNAVTRAIEKQIEKLKVLRGETISVRDASLMLGDGFTNMQAGALAMMKLAGATAEQMIQLSDSFRQYNEITGVNTFDKSAAGMERLRKAIAETEQVNQLANKGYSLTREQLVLLSRDMARTTQAFESQKGKVEVGKKVYTDLKEALQALEKEFVQLAGKQNELAEAALRAQEAAKEQARISERNGKLMMDSAVREFRERQRIAQETERLAKEAASFNNDAVMLFIKNEEKKRAESERTARVIEANNKRAMLIEEGFSRQEANKIVGLEKKGISNADARRQIEVDRAAAEIERENIRLKRERTKAERDKVNALKYTQDAEARLARQIDEANRLNEEHTTDLVKYERALLRAGFAADVAATKTAAYKNSLDKLEFKNKQRDIENLGRAMSVQLGDVAISLASGQNPFIVLLQQGDQIRGAIQQASVDSKQLATAMSAAFRQIVTSFIDVGRALGGFVVGAFKDAGNAISGFISRATGLAPMLDDIRTRSEANAASLSLFEKSFLRFATVLGSAIPALLGGFVTFLGVLAISAIAAARENDALVKSITITGGALGMSADSVFSFAASMQELGFATGQTLEVVKAAGKTGEIFGRELEMVTTAAVNLYKYGGVAIEDTVKVFASIRKDPVKALEEVADRTGLVSLETIRLVASLQEQGQEFEAVEVAMRAYADVAKEQSDRVKNDLSGIGSVITMIKEEFVKLKDAFVGLTRDESVLTSSTKRLEELKKLASESGGKGPLFGKKAFFEELAQTQALVNALQQQEAEKQKIAENDKIRREIEEKNRKELEASLSSEEKYRKRIAELTQRYSNTSDLKQQADILKIISREQEKFEKAQERKTRPSGGKSQAEKDLEIYNALIAKSDGLTADYTEKMEALNRMKSQGKIEQEQYNEAVQALVNLQPFRIKYLKEETKAEEDRKKMLDKARNIVEDLMNQNEGLNKSYNESVKAVQELSKEENWDISKTERILELLRAIQPEAKKIEEAYKAIVEKQKEQNANLEIEEKSMAFRMSIMNLSAAEKEKALKQNEYELKMLRIKADLEKEIREIQEKQPAGKRTEELIDKAKENAARRQILLNREVALAAAEDFLKAFRDIEKSLADVITTALFEGGKAGRTKLREVIMQKLREPIQVTVEAFVKDAIGMFTGGINGGQAVMSGSGGLAGIGSILSSLSGSVQGSIRNQFDTFARGTTGERLGLSNMVEGMTSSAKMISQALGSIGGAMAGAKLYEGISGGYRTNKWVDLQGKLGGAIPGEMGMIVAAVAGGINRLFGRKLKDAGVQGSFGGDKGFSGESFQFYKGGFLRSDKTKTSPLDAELTEGLGKQFKAVQTQMAFLTNNLGLNTDAIVNYVKQIKFSTQGLTEEQIGQKLQEEFEGIAEDMAKLALAGTDYSLANETAVQTLERLSASLLTANESLRILGLRTFDVSLAGADAASKFATLFGDIGNMTNVLNTFYQEFYTEQERTANATKMLTEQFAALGYDALPATREGFRALVEAADAAGDRTLVGNLLMLAPAFAEIVEATEGLGKSVEDYLNELRNAKRTNQEIAQSIFDMEKRSRELSIALLEAQGRFDLADSAARQLAREGLTEAEVALLDFNDSLQNQIDVLNERKGIEEQILEVTGNTVELRNRELAALDPANRELKKFYYSLLDVAEAARQAQELSNLVDEVLPKFMSLGEQQEFFYNKQAKTLIDANIFTGVSVKDLAARLSGLSRNEIREYATQLVRSGQLTSEQSIILVRAADAIADYNDQVAETAKEFRRNEIAEQLQEIADVYGDLSVIEPPKKTVSELYSENVAVLDQLFEFFGQKAEQTFLDVITNTLEQVNGIRDFRASLQEQIDSARMQGMSRGDRVNTLRQREASLFAELKTSNNPVAVAQKLQQTILDRIREEAELRKEGAQEQFENEQKNRDAQMESIRSQMSALERMKKLSDDIAQFTGSLRFSDISPLNYEDQLNAARSLFEKTLADARAGDENAQSNLIGNARAYLDEARSFFASGTQYASIFGGVTGSLDEFGLAGEAVDPQLAALQSQLTYLENLSTQQQAAIDAAFQTSADEVAALTALDVAIGERETQMISLLEEQRDELKNIVAEQKAQLEQAAAIANDLKAELAELNGGVAVLNDNLTLANADPSRD